MRTAELSFEGYQRYIIRYVLFLILPIVAILTFTGMFNALMGFGFGSILSILNLRLLGLNIRKLAHQTTSGRVRSFMFKHEALRFLLMGFFLYVSLGKGYECFWGACAGLMVCRIAIFGLGFLKRL